FVRDELRIAAMYKRQVIPVWAAGRHWMDSVPLGLGSTQRVDARGTRYDEALREVLELLRETEKDVDDVFATPPGLKPLKCEPRTPFKGLRAFGTSDARDFFGRDALIDDLVRALGRETSADGRRPSAPRMLAIIGPSGSGKSSLAVAGFIPHLQSGVLP